MTAMCDIVDLEEVLSKTGAELFKELYRLYPVADPEDYYKVGQWRNDMMKTDIVLLERHRRESGAPDVPDLEDLKFPKMPDEHTWPSQSAFTSFGLGLKLQGPSGVAPTAPAVSGVATGAAPASTPVVEIRLIALFVAKWKLDPVTSKTALAKLTPTRRRYVIQNFKTQTTGAEATKELESFITECEADGSWDSTTPAANGAAANGDTPAVQGTVAGQAAVAAAKAHNKTLVPQSTITPKQGLKPVPLGTVVAPNPALSGLKRPVGAVAPNPAFQQNKRPVFTPAQPQPAKAGATDTPAKAGGALMNKLLSGF